MPKFSFCWLCYLVLIISTYSVEGVVIVVGPGGTGDYETISEALVASASGDDIWVRAGRYHEAIEMKEGVSLYGGFPVSGTPEWEDRDWAANETIIDATGLETSTVVGADDAVLDGFTITGGDSRSGGGLYCISCSPTIDNCAITGNSGWDKGSGVFCGDHANPRLTNCTITGGVAQYGGGVYCEGNSEPTLTGCTITGNSGGTGGGVNCVGSSPTIESCTISGNTAALGGGLACESSSSPQITGCWIIGNSARQRGGGADCHRSSSPTFTNCIVNGNRADIGGGINCSDRSSPTLRDCTIAGNSDGGGLNSYLNCSPILITCMITGNSGAGASCNLSGLTLINCTVADNVSPRAGGIICAKESSATITNCILWNAGVEIVEASPRDAAVTYSCIQGGWPAETNIDSFPEFVDAPGGDYRLREGSCCISAGTDVGLAFDGPAPDIGAWEAPAEYAGGPCSHNPRVVRVRSDAAEGGDGSSWEQAFRTIAAALEVTSSSDEVWVAAGGYNESVFLEPTANVYGGFSGIETARGDRDWNLYETIIDATGLGGAAVIGTDDSFLDGFTITGADSHYGGGVYCMYTSPTAVNCKITGNTGYIGGGAYLRYSSASFVNCAITGNTGTRGGGVFCGSSPATFENCTITRNSADSKGGGIESSGSRLTLVKCTIADNSAELGSGIYDGSKVSPTLVDCILWNPGEELTGPTAANVVVAYSCIQGGWPGEGNIDAYPMFENPEINDYRLQNGSCCINAGTDVGLPFEGSAPDMGSWEAPAEYSGGPCLHTPGIVRVRSEAAPGGDGTSWERAFPTLQAALEVVSTSDEVWVAAGRYAESICLEPRVCIYGGFAGSETTRYERDWETNETLIDATGLSTHAVNGVDGGFLDGFTVTGGNSDRGGGVFCNEASPALANLTITGNSADEGGGVYCRKSGPTLIRCVVASNTASGSGGGLYCLYSPPSLISCTLRQNSAGDRGGGLSFCDGSVPKLANCLMISNTAGGRGGGVYSEVYSAARFENCTFTANRAPRGGALGAGDYTIPQFQVLYNCVLWGDVPDEIYPPYHFVPTPTPNAPPGSSETASPESSKKTSAVSQWGLTVAFSCVKGGWYYGPGNIDADPRFVQPWDGSSADLHLQADSPCIDRGDNEAAADIPTDLDGNVRIWDGDEVPGAVVDMGAYEFAAPFPGDTNGDRRITGADLFTFSCWWEDERNTENAACDPTGDRNIDREDLLWLLPHWCREH